MISPKSLRELSLFMLPVQSSKKAVLGEVGGIAGVAHNYPKQKDSGLNFLKDTNVIQNLVWSIFSGMMVARWLNFYPLDFQGNYEIDYQVNFCRYQKYSIPAMICLGKNNLER